MVISLERGADLHMAQLMPLPLTVLLQYNPDVVPDRGPLNGCVCVCVRACVRACVCARLSHL